MHRLSNNILYFEWLMIIPNSCTSVYLQSCCQFQLKLITINSQFLTFLCVQGLIGKGNTGVPTHLNISCFNILNDCVLTTFFMYNCGGFSSLKALMCLVISPRTLRQIIWSCLHQIVIVNTAFIKKLKIETCLTKKK